MKTRIVARGALLASVLTLALAPAATAQEGVDPQKAAETVVGAVQKTFGGGITSHSYDCQEGRPAVQAVVNGVKDSLKYSYPDISTMAARGYAPYPDAFLLGLSGGQGHWLNPGFLEDGHIMDPKRPEGILVDRYQRPIGVMFIADDPHVPGPDMYVDDATGVPCNGWHYHGEITADAYWYAYKYGWSGDTQTALGSGDLSKLQPPDRTPDLMHVWAYGADGVAPDGTQLFKYQFQHATPPAKYMPPAPDVTDPNQARCIVGGFRPPGANPC
ncbi:MAG: hypothetical protein QOI91_1859 [Solirubrobacteraceae bacterium]|jgi:hypothetical protein|nr:hypothetical protein [Solirubrobacteraceae bacterium]